jgi:hypothetical protein
MLRQAGNIEYERVNVKTASGTFDQQNGEMFSYQNYIQKRWFKPVLKGWGKKLKYLKIKHPTTTLQRIYVFIQKLHYTDIFLCDDHF